MPENAVNWPIVRERKYYGKMYVQPEVVVAFRSLSPRWENFDGKKIADIIDRGLPKFTGSNESISLDLPEGKGKAMIHFQVDLGPTDGSIMLQLHPKKKIKIANT